ncbi:MAG: hypothetical protein BWY11_01472 [Firmicutes bacterium ADurb.Bin182]|nr:MAG: hypothetical protein BWY11_01472 [Firmicutes bacterium ADurb.Bin182]
MKVWGIIKKDHRIQNDIVADFAVKREECTDWRSIIGSIAGSLDLSRPVVLKKHIQELHDFSRTVFKPSDFMESVAFDRFEIEIFPEKSKK